MKTTLVIICTLLTSFFIQSQEVLAISGAKRSEIELFLERFRIILNPTARIWRVLIRYIHC